MTMWIQDLNIAACIMSKARHQQAPKSSGHDGQKKNKQDYLMDIVFAQHNPILSTSPHCQFPPSPLPMISPPKATKYRHVFSTRLKPQTEH